MKRGLQMEITALVRLAESRFPLSVHLTHAIRHPFREPR